MLTKEEIDLADEVFEQDITDNYLDYLLAEFEQNTHNVNLMCDILREARRVGYEGEPIPSIQKFLTNGD